MSSKQSGSIEDYGVVIYKTYAGSRAYGTNITEEKAKQLATEHGGSWEDYVSDVDIRGIFIPYPKYLYGAQKVDQFNDPQEEDTVYFSLEKFLQLALEGNPNVVEQLFVRDEDVLYMHPIGESLRNNRNWFLTKNVYGRFGAYAWSQLKRMTVQNEAFKRNEKRQKIIDLTATNEGTRYDAKNAMHLVRLFQMGIQILTDGTLDTYRPNVEELLNIRNGNYSLEDMHAYAEQLNQQLQEAMKHSTIPNVPDVEAVNTWAIEAVQQAFPTIYQGGAMPCKPLRILPVEYDMVDTTTLFLVANPLTRAQSRSQAQGLFIPYQDWFIGLRHLEEFKFDQTTIEFIHKFIGQVRACNPRHIDTLFAPPEAFLYQHPMAEEFLLRMRSELTSKKAPYIAKGYITGNLKKMMLWEQLKKEHDQFKQDVQAAKCLQKSDWEQRLEALENNRVTLGQTFQKEKDALLRQFRRWEELVNTKGNLPLYPSIPKDTPNENASNMGKYGYDTLLASQLYHVSQLFIELLATGTIENSRAYEEDMYAIKHGAYATFEAFHAYMQTQLEQLEKVAITTPLPKALPKDTDAWLLDYIARYMQTL